jgi:hypothetical protein
MITLSLVIPTKEVPIAIGTMVAALKMLKEEY